MFLPTDSNTAMLDPSAYTPDKTTEVPTPPLTDSSPHSPPLHNEIHKELSNLHDPTRSLDGQQNAENPKLADETVANLLFPPLPGHFSSGTAVIYRILSAILSIVFLFFVVLISMLMTLPSILWVLSSWCQFKDPNRLRPFYLKEKERKNIPVGELKSDVRYYAQRVGLECKEFKIQTEDGFILTIHHIVDERPGAHEANKKYPVLMLHGLMQSSGAYCVNDDASLAFYLCKSGYDVWLGNNRGYFKPGHVTLKPSDPRFWAWNLREMGCLDIPAMLTYICTQTNRKKVALIAHSQGTTISFLALAKDQVPSLGDSLSCFIALAPAVFAGTLLKKFQFSFVKIMSARVYRAFFGIHSFIPLMMTIHSILEPHVYAWLGYRVFNYLFAWTDLRWERRLRNRFFQFSPVYVSAACMQWWLGRECFARHKCILPYTQTPWYDPERMPPVSLFVGGRDKLVDGKKLIERFEEVEKDVVLLRGQVDEEYEHLDCIWSMDCIERVGEKVREDIWHTVLDDDVIVPEGCKEEERGSKVQQKERVHREDRQN